MPGGVLVDGHLIAGSFHRRLSAHPFWYATMFTDALAGMAVLAFVYVVMVYERARPGA